VTASPSDDPDVAYFRDIERAFVERRGDPLFISNADWVFLAGLRRKGVPMRVVLRGIKDAFDAHAHSFSRKQKIRSFKFCEPQITAAVERYRRALQIEGPSRRGLSAALEQLGSQLTAGPVAQEVKDACAEAKLSLLAAATAAREDKALDADGILARIEDQLVRAASGGLRAEELSEIEKATRDATAAYKSRMPPKVYETLIGESVRRKILQRFGLPRLLLAEIE